MTAVCKFISEAFNEGRLEPDPGNAQRRLKIKPAIQRIAQEGVCFLPVAYRGCSQKSEEEGRVVQEYYGKLIGQSFVDNNGAERLTTANDILVVSPYNVQVNYLKSILPAVARVGTVDKFQGQKAPVVLISMATSDAECNRRRGLG